MTRSVGARLEVIYWICSVWTKHFLVGSCAHNIANIPIKLEQSEAETSPRKMRKQFQASPELRMLSSVTLNCQVTKIVMNSGSQLSECVINVLKVTSL